MMMMTTTTWRTGLARTSAGCPTADAGSDLSMSTAAGLSSREARSGSADRDDRSVLLMLDPLTATSVAIQRASELCGALELRLHVVLAIPHGSSSVHPAQLTGHVSDVLRLRAPRAGYGLEIVQGEIAAVVGSIASQEGATIVVVDARYGAREACRLAEDTNLPVLVARDARPDGAWVAASDMLNARLPVLSATRDLAAASDRALVCFHNAPPVSVVMSDPMAGPTTYVDMLALQDDAVEAKQARLDRFSVKHTRTQALVTRSDSTIEALGALVRDRDIDLIAIGHRKRSWLSQLLHRGTSRRLVERSRRSVLIVPLDGHELSATGEAPPREV